MARGIRRPRPQPERDLSAALKIAIIRLNSAFTPATAVSDRDQGGTPCVVSREGLMLICLMLPAMA
jgi:hypothetical protein